MANPHPPPFSTGIDATDVTKFFEDVIKPTAKKVGLAIADAALSVAGDQIKNFTPDDIDRLVDEVVADLRAKLKEAAQ